MTNQSLTCPDCDSTAFTASVLAAFGPEDMLGLRCEDCGRMIARVAVKGARADVDETIAEVFDDE